MIVRRGLLQMTLAALLLAAQHGAFTHEVQHLRDPLPVQMQTHDSGKKAAHSGLCKFHASYAEVLGAVDCAKLPLRVAANTAESGASHLSRAFPADLVVPASRGPPVLL